MATRYTYRTRTYTPGELHGIAHQFRAAANTCRTLASRIRASLGSLDSTWAGNARNRFFAEHGDMAQRLEGLAAYYSDLAGQIDSMTVSVQERVEL